jgi:hypothetical protein
MSPNKFISIIIATVIVSISALVMASQEVVAGKDQTLITKKSFNYDFNGKNIGEEFNLSEKIEEDFKPNKICEQKNKVCTSSWKLKITAEKTEVVHDVDLTDLSMDPKNLQYLPPLPDEISKNSDPQVIAQMQYLLAKRNILLDLHGKPQKPTGNWLYLTDMAVAMLSNLKGIKLWQEPRALASVITDLRKNYVQHGNKYSTIVPFHGDRYTFNKGSLAEQQYMQSKALAEAASFLRPPKNIEYDIKNPDPKVRGTLRVE